MLKIFSKNWRIKLFCLVAAGSLWVYVAAQENSVGKLPGSIPIKALNTPPGLMAIYDTRNVEIKIMAQPSTWKNLSTDSFTAYVDLASLSEGTYELNVNVQSSVDGVEIIQKTPDKIMVSLEKVINKDVGVGKRIEGSAADGWVTADIALTPEKVTIRGPKSIVDNISEATALIVLRSESEDFTRNFTVTAYDGEGKQINNVIFDPPEVEGRVKLTKASNNKTVGVKVKVVGQLKAGYYISEIATTPNTIDVIGSRNILPSLSYLETLPVNVSDISSTLEKDVYISLKEGVAFQTGNSGKVHVVIKVAESESSKEIVATINPTNLSGYNISSMNPDQIKVVCSGPISAINNLKSSDVILNLDFSNQKLVQNPETVTFSLVGTMFKVSNGVYVTNFSPTSLSVNLTK